MMAVTRPVLIGFVLTLMITVGAAAFSPETTTLDCVFEHQSTIKIEKGKPTNDDGGQEPLLTTFTGFNERDGSAIMVGNAGSTPLTFFSDTSRWVLVEVTRSGNVMVTSMTVPSATGETYAVHSRHGWLLGTGLISQWAGTCKTR